MVRAVQQLTCQLGRAGITQQRLEFAAARGAVHGELQRLVDDAIAVEGEAPLLDRIQAAL